ncbi:MAG: M50 family metallopeptidase [Sphingomonas sp.]|uniref:M50 family metallopeptidase n=1 Tax=Sphingomonas sp. TaxID=28214 RepID=UPI0025EB3C33|nr:M50 family metallopeptidase [Sphingomonas sp.]MBX9882775.1 M50 family metallopeptidase [Sphingomonas sp.]
MSQSPGLLITLLAFVLVIGPLVFVHELGHYLVGRWCGVKADEFSIGFGRELFGLTDKRGTRWRFGWLPIGGYVKFAGDMDPSSRTDPDWLALPAEERAKTFPAKPVWQRALIVAAGPLTNFLVALLILAGFAMAIGEARVPTTVGLVEPGSAAATAGLRPGDRITALGGRPVDQFQQMVDYVRLRPGARVRIDYSRAGAPRSTEAVVGTTVVRDRFGNIARMGRLGLGYDPATVRYDRVGLLEAPRAALTQMGRLLGMMRDTIGQIIVGERSVKELGGPLQIAKVSGEQLAQGTASFVYLIALVSINLAVINLLPVPVLDGGHLLFYAIEAVRRRPVDARVMDLAFRGGLAAVLALMLMVTINDLGSFGLWSRLAGLIG